jgi:hypothetical protein
VTRQIIPAGKKGSGKLVMNTAQQSSVSHEEQETYLEKVLRSEVLSQAPGLVKFLEFVGHKVIEGHSDEIKEATIGGEAFGRSADFDPKVDAIVRVEAHRLREKLKEYYNHEGASDEVQIDLPKGHYVPRFSRRNIVIEDKRSSPDVPASPAELPLPTPPAPRAAVVPIQASRRNVVGSPLIQVAVALAAVALLIGFAFLLHHLHNVAAKEVSRLGSHPTLPTTSRGDPLKDLWANFLEPDSAPLATYNNDLYLETSSRDLLRLKSQEVIDVGSPAENRQASKLVANPRLLDHAGPLFFADSYTGTGEAMSIFYITRLFTRFDSSLGVIRCRLLTPTILAQHDLIMLGSPMDNPVLARLPLNQDFVITLSPKATSDGLRKVISNPHPVPGEQSFYEIERDPTTQAVRTDYAVVSFLPGIAPNRIIAIFAGLTTLGTQAAAQFATCPTQGGELAARLDPASHRNIPRYFQVVLKVQILKDEVLSVEYVAGHVIHPDPHAVWFPEQ